MRTRAVVEAFSTFLQFESDRFQKWIADARLRRSMERAIAASGRTESDPGSENQADNFWALYWHRLWSANLEHLEPERLEPERLEPEHLGPEHLGRQHLIAYMQEPCYWAAQKTAENFVSTQYSLADCFQMAIAQSDKVIKGFDAAHGYSFKNYASATLNSLIRETLRQTQEVDICTDWGLLRKISQKRLTEALQLSGLGTSAIAHHILAWTCFKTLYLPKQANATRKLSKPEPETWVAIAQLYHQEVLGMGGEIATVTLMEKYLATCAKAARSYLQPQILSINTPKPGQESGEFLDDLVDTVQTDSLLTDLIAQEESEVRQQQRNQLTGVLQNAIAQLDESSQALVKYYYSEKLTQQEMATRLDMKQYTVSRRLTKARETLLMALAQWRQDTLHIPASTDLIKNTSAVLEEWLETYLAA
jgi:RNA polymerase sigma factor (sigma-70 family)